MHSDSPARIRVWEGVIEACMGEQVDVPRQGRIGLVTAGPPGGGKSTMVRQLLGEQVRDWRVIDSDDVKVHLIRQVVNDQDYEQILRIDLADGRPIMPMELAGLVHEESVQIANEIRRRAMSSGENVVVCGTLAWDGMIDIHLGEVAMHGYDELQIALVDVSRDVARARSLARWWAERDDPNTEMGGRYVPASVINDCYLNASGTSATACRRNVDELQRRARRLEGLTVRLLQTSSDQLDAAKLGDKPVRFRVVGGTTAD